MPDISNNPIANAAIATTESARRDSETQQVSRARPVEDAVQATATGVASGPSAGPANGVAATQRVSDVSVSSEARQRLAAESAGQGVQPAGSGGGNALQQRINELLGDPSAAPAPEGGAPADVSGGRGVSGGESARGASATEGGPEASRAAVRGQPAPVDQSAARIEQRTAADASSPSQSNNDLTGNPERLQRA